MERKFYIRGYKETAEFPVLYDDNNYSLEEARVKANEYFEKIAPLCKVIIFEQEDGEEERAAKFIFRNRFGNPEEISDWWEAN